MINHILKDILSFIRRFLQWKANPNDQRAKPFTSMRTIHGHTGLISLVEGRDTPQAVRTWSYSPKRWM